MMEKIFYLIYIPIYHFSTSLEETALGITCWHMTREPILVTLCTKNGASYPSLSCSSRIFSSRKEDNIKCTRTGEISSKQKDKIIKHKVKTLYQQGNFHSLSFNFQLWFTITFSTECIKLSLLWWKFFQIKICLFVSKLVAWPISSIH